MAIRQDMIVAIRRADGGRVRVANVDDKYPVCEYPADPDKVSDAPLLCSPPARSVGISGGLKDSIWAVIGGETVRYPAVRRINLHLINLLLGRRWEVGHEKLVPIFRMRWLHKFLIISTSQQKPRDASGLKSFVWSPCMWRVTELWSLLLVDLQFTLSLLLQRCDKQSGLR
jgi:hypothetical protein